MTPEQLARFKQWLGSHDATRQLDAALAETSRPMVMCAWCQKVMQTGSEPATQSICDDCGERVLVNGEGDRR